MFYMGTSITSSSTDTLKPVTSYTIYDSIAHPLSEISELIEKIRRVKQIDKKAYDIVKKRLPYFTCSEFAHSLRKQENFIRAHGLVLDLDYCFQSEEQFSELRAKLQSDDRVVLLFTSPGGRGIKLVFQFALPCPSTKVFSDFYKCFSAQFASQYGIEKFIDFQTHDASRVCFYSADPQAYYNPMAEAINWSNTETFPDSISNCPWVEDSPTGNPLPESTNPERDENTNKQDSIQPEIYSEILKKLNPRAKIKRQKIIYCPDELEQIVKPVTDLTAKMGLEIREIRDIHYGKKIVILHGIHFAEVNVFYGKTGFSVTLTPKSGSNIELGKVAVQLVENVIFELAQVNYKHLILEKSISKN